MDALHYFHYGQLVHHGEAKGDMRVLAKSSGISEDFINLALETAKVPALPDTVGVSWGMLRTRRGQPLIFARAEENDAGILIYQFIEMPTDAVRELAGNLAILSDYLTTPLPSYAMLGEALAPITLGEDVSLSVDEQVDSLLNLMSYARNNTRNIEPLVGTIISGTPLLIINAPKDGDVRAEFIQGLLMLLPPSTRLGVTFLLHSTPETDLKAQIKFMETLEENDNQVVYDWETGKVSGKEIKNDYSRFVTSQMRLDPELVTRETFKLTKTAGWRFNNGDNLATALDYASHRAKVDQSLENGMPVEVSSVAKILSEDPTLSDEQRMMYSRHLINFSLALDDLQYVDSITATMHQHPELEDEVHKYMAKALDAGQGAIIFETLVRWQENPFSPTGAKWQEMLSKSALLELDELIENQDIEVISEYLDDIKLLGSQASPIIGRVIDRVLPFTERDPSIPTKILLLAIRNLDDTKLQALMSTSRFIRPLPTDVKRMLVLFSQRDRKAPPGALFRAVQSIPENERTVALITFVKQAYSNQRIDLIDERVLAELVKVLNINPMLLDRRTVMGIVESIQINTLSTMKRPAPRLLLQLLLITRSYNLLDVMIVAQSRDIYGASDQSSLIKSVQETFSKTTLSASDAMEAIEALEKKDMGKVLLTVAILGALEGTSWSSELKPLADKVMKDVANSQRLLDVLPSQSIYSLLQFCARQGDAKRLRIAARVMGSCAAYDKSKVGLRAANHAYKMLYSSKRTRPYAIEVIRQYVREAEEKPAHHMIKFYGDRLGADIAKKLQLSYEFSNLMARMDWLTYSTSLQITVDLLQSLVEAYAKPNARPNLGDARLLTEHFRKNLSLGEQRNLSKELRRLAHAIVVLGQRHDRRSSSSDRYNEAIANGSHDPRSSLDVYRSVGGYLLGNTVHPLRIRDGNAQKPLGDFSSDDLLINITIASSVLNEAINARPSSRNMWTHDALVDEVKSQVSTLIGKDTNDLRQMGRSWQRLADLIIYISKNGDTKVIESRNAKGRKLDKLEREPESVLELMRFVYGYFSE
ncbi:MAG: hypothetical protein Phog2KO_25860 [Phototrophicaceae bacterium]